MTKPDSKPDGAKARRSRTQSPVDHSRTLSQALESVLYDGFRRIDVPFIDSRGNKHLVAVYRCGEKLIRADFKS